MIIVSMSLIGTFMIVTLLFIVTLLITNKSLDIELVVHNMAYQFAVVQND
jgi:hypothetical protein